MKITIEVDCTPDEARQFMGLPDLKPMQAAVTAQLERQILDAVGNFSPEGVLRSWLSLMPPGSEPMRDMVSRFFRPPGAKPGDQG